MHTSSVALLVFILLEESPAVLPWVQNPHWDFWVIYDAALSQNPSLCLEPVSHIHTDILLLSRTHTQSVCWQMQVPCSCVCVCVWENFINIGQQRNSQHLWLMPHMFGFLFILLSVTFFCSLLSFILSHLLAPTIIKVGHRYSEMHQLGTCHVSGNAFTSLLAWWGDSWWLVGREAFSFCCPW